MQLVGNLWSAMCSWWETSGLPCAVSGTPLVCHVQLVPQGSAADAEIRIPSYNSELSTVLSLKSEVRIPSYNPELRTVISLRPEIRTPSYNPEIRMVLSLKPEASWNIDLHASLAVRNSVFLIDAFSDRRRRRIIRMPSFFIQFMHFSQSAPNVKKRVT